MISYGQYKNIIKRASALILAAFVLAAGIIYPCAAEGDGGAVILIETPQDFASLSKNCVYDSYSRGMKVTLLNDIDMEGVDFEPMKIFCGTFEGGGHQIKNIKLSFDGSTKGLCFELGRGGEIRDLNVSGTVKAKKSAEAATSINEIIGSVAKNAGLNSEEFTQKTSVSVLGGIVGTNSGRIINCTFDGEIEGDIAVGGIAGENREDGYIEACRNFSSIIGNSDTGGVAGRNYGWIKAGRNDGKINSEPIEDSRNTGGVAGMNDGVLEACMNSAEIGYKNVGYNIGGIAGRQSGCILECENSGAVLGAKSVGGIFGRFEPFTDISITDLDELRENVKNDVDDTRKNIKNDIDGYQERINNDVNDILDRLGFGGRGGLLSTLLGLSDARDTFADTLNSIGESQSGLIDAIRGDVENSGFLGSLSDTMNSLQVLNESGAALLDTINGETSGDLGNAIDSINNTIENAETMSDTANTLLSDIDSIVNDINEAYDSGDLETVADRLDDLSGRLDYVQDTMLRPMSSSITSAMNSLSRTLNALRSDANDITGAVERPLNQLNNVLKDAQTKLDAANTEINEMQQEIKQTVEKIRGYLDSINLPKFSPGIIGSAVSDIFFTRVYADDMINLSDDELRRETRDIMSVDVSTPRDVAGMPTDNAVVIYCVSSGKISGENDVGGIGGTIGIESAVKNGQNITLPSGKIITTTSVVKAVVNGCVSENNVESKNGYAGGIVGDANFGVIKNSLSRGEINGGENGSYVGGTAGYSNGKISGCAAINDLSGKDTIGGIAGEADNITTCYSLPRINGTPEKSGAIAGTSDGTVLNNYFIKEGLSGVNGADFDGKAVALEWYEITGTDTVPEMMKGFLSDEWYVGSGDIFLPQNRVLSDNTAASIGALIKAKSADMARFHFKVEFVADDNTVKNMTVDYGTVIDESEVPELETRDGYCPQWSRDTTEPIRRDTKFIAEYIDAVRTIGTDEEPPLLLVEGNFKDGAKVRAWETDPAGDYASAYTFVAAYDFEIEPEYNGMIKVHIRDKEKKGNYIGIVRDGKTRILEAERDGSYLIFELDGESEFTVLHKRSNIWLLGGIVLVAAGVLLAIALFIRRQIRS